MKVATAESCTGGLLASLLTDVEGAGHGFDRGFVTYDAKAKQELLGLPAGLVERNDAVTAAVAHAMAKGALQNSDPDIALSVTGFAGPGSPEAEEGLVHSPARVADCRQRRAKSISETWVEGRSA